jgi:regulator of cell morphogenesis and NO signaling
MSGITTTNGFRNRPVGEVVAEDYARAAVFQRFGIDFCCGGKRTVAAACAKAGVAPETVERELDVTRASDAQGPWADPGSWDLDLLTTYIEKTHHRYVRKTLPALVQFSDKVARVHGDTRPELLVVRDLVRQLAGEMEQHMLEEERVVFPRIAGLEHRVGAGEPSGMGEAVESLEDDHERAGALMARIRELTDGFAPPAGACNTYRATYTLLEQFERDLHRHVHLENNVLFPRAAAIEARLGGRSVDGGTPAA